MTTDDILSLSGDVLDAMVAEKVMGWAVEKYKGVNGYAWNIIELHVALPFEPSKDARGMKRVLDRMIELGWEPMFYHNDSGWHVSFTKDKMSTVLYNIQDLKEAVCKCALIAVMEVE